MTELVRLAQKNRELLVESSVTYLRVGDTIVVDTSDQNEVRIYYHRNCVTFDFYHQISLVEDNVLQLTIALQLKGEEHAAIVSHQTRAPNMHRRMHGVVQYDVLYICTTLPCTSMATMATIIQLLFAFYTQNKICIR